MRAPLFFGQQLVVVVVALLLTSTTTTTPTRACPAAATTPSAPITLAAYAGRWYEYARSWTVKATFEHDCVCTQARYSATSRANVVKVVNACKRDGVAGRYTNITGVASVDNPLRPGQLSVQFPGSPVGNYWVLLADTERYSLVYSCAALVVQFAWVLTRERTLDDAVYTALLANASKIVDYDFAAHLEKTVQVPACGEPDDDDASFTADTSDATDSLARARLLDRVEARVVA